MGSGKVVNGLAEDLFARLQSRSVAFNKKAGVGELMNRVLRDSRYAQQFLENLLFRPLVALFTIIWMLLLMIKMDAMLTLVACFASPLSWGISAMMSRRLRIAAKVNRQIEDQIQSLMQQVFSGIGVVQAFAQEEYEKGRFRRLGDRHIQSQIASIFIGKLGSLGTGFVGVVASGSVLWLASRHVLGGSLTLGGALLFLTYFGVLQMQLGILTNAYFAIPEVSEAVDRIAQIINTPAEIANRPCPKAVTKISGQVEFRTVTAGYDGIPVIKNISLLVEPGQTVALIGPTGSGKTTLVNLIPRFQEPWEGSVRIDGLDVQEIGIENLRKQISIVFQEPYLFPCSVAENISYGCPDATPDQIESAARSAQAHGFIMALPQGYKTVIGERGTTLSGGMRQRISIARALLKNAPILILD